MLSVLISTLNVSETVPPISDETRKINASLIKKFRVSFVISSMLIEIIYEWICIIIVFLTNFCKRTERIRWN